MDRPSIWDELSNRTRSYPHLDKEIEVDVVIIGAGITGCTTAYELQKLGKKVAIIEAKKVGGVTTSHSTGNLYIPVGIYYQRIERKFDLEVATKIAEARKSAIDYIEKVVNENTINCFFARRPWFAYSIEENNSKLEKEVEIFKKMGVPIEEVHTLPLPFKFKKAYSLPNQARMNPLQYVISLADVLVKNGCQIFEDSRVTHYEEKGDMCIAETAHGKVRAKKLLLATHTPAGVNTCQIFTAPYRSYAIGAHLKDHHYAEGHYWDFDNPTHVTSEHAINNSNKPEIILISGSHHKVGQGKDMASHFVDLESYMNRTMQVDTVKYGWSAQHYQTADTIPYIGLTSRYAKHMYLATGYFADGLLYGTMAAMILSKTMFQSTNEFAHTVDSTRLDIFKSLPFLAKENSNVFFQYLKDIPFPGTKNFDDIKVGEGKVLEINREKCAVSRDDQNQLHIVSAVCTHMKCIVNWNNTEKTWDCPCHGSRFTQKGEVIEGPAMYDLEKRSLD